MSEAAKRVTSEQLPALLREVRARYDALARGATASLRRCRTADDVELEPVYWHVAGSLGRQYRALPHAVLHFPLARQDAARNFSFGRFLARQLRHSDGARLRFRRLIDARDRDELDHRLRAMLRLACADGAPVDWGVLGSELLWFFGERGSVRRKWAQDFYAPSMPDPGTLATLDQ